MRLSKDFAFIFNDILVFIGIICDRYLFSPARATRIGETKICLYTALSVPSPTYSLSLFIFALFVITCKINRLRLYFLSLLLTLICCFLHSLIVLSIYNNPCLNSQYHPNIVTGKMYIAMHSFKMYIAVYGILKSRCASYLYLSFGSYDGGWSICA